jgi:drug/metabolite transporter (DMT)-like permease
LLKKNREKMLPPKDSILPLFLMGVTGAAIFNLFQFLAIAKTSSIYGCFLFSRFANIRK